MLEKPDLHDAELIDCLCEAYKLNIVGVVPKNAAHLDLPCPQIAPLSPLAWERGWG
jgi:hypothetical protein